MSLIQKDQNVRELMSSASSVVDVATIRNRFVHHELFKTDTSYSLSMPEDLRELSQAYLQFLWNLLSSKYTVKKYIGIVGLTYLYTAGCLVITYVQQPRTTTDGVYVRLLHH